MSITTILNHQAELFQGTPQAPAHDAGTRTGRGGNPDADQLSQKKQGPSKPQPEQVSPHQLNQEKLHRFLLAKFPDNTTERPRDLNGMKTQLGILQTSMAESAPQTNTPGEAATRAQQAKLPTAVNPYLPNDPDAIHQTLVHQLGISAEEADAIIEILHNSSLQLKV
ncbi:hypothetical protein [Desulfogranum mediterraneum]|uniref:hypothetical protein n=1 Tax=Desulfogranum mediterraneum TaxID=160661 RepID=UPI000415D1BB|nr:hypothetical protein [Desulfogranum mediterraneum]